MQNMYLLYKHTGLQNIANKISDLPACCFQNHSRSPIGTVPYGWWKAFSSSRQETLGDFFSLLLAAKIHPWKFDFNSLNSLPVPSVKTLKAGAQVHKQIKQNTSLRDRTCSSSSKIAKWHADIFTQRRAQATSRTKCHLTVSWHDSWGVFSFGQCRATPWQDTSQVRPGSH